MSRRRGQTGYVWQKNQIGNKSWDATAPAYGQVWIDVPGKEKRQRKFYQLGECRTKSEARRRLKEMIEKDVHQFHGGHSAINRLNHIQPAG